MKEKKKRENVGRKEKKIKSLNKWIDFRATESSKHASESKWLQFTGWAAW